MGQFDQLFSSIMSSKKMGGNYASRIPLGRHKLAIKKYFPKEATKKNQGLIIECDFFTLESTSLQYGDTRNEPWFLGNDEYGYEADRSRDFITAVAESLGTPAGDGAQIGEWLILGALNGLFVTCDVTQQFQKDGSTPKTDKKGNPIFLRTWSGIAGQNAETVKAVAQAMSQFTPAPAPQVVQAQQSPAQQNQAAFAAPVQQQVTQQPAFQMPTQQAAQPAFTAPVQGAAPGFQAPTFGGFQAPIAQPMQPSAPPQAAPAQAAPAGIADILNTLKR